MRRSYLLLVAPVFSLAAACTQKEPVKEVIPYPKMVLSADTVDFGELQWGETAQRTVWLSNEGYDINAETGEYIGMTMGVGSKSEGFTGIDIGPGMDGNFVVTWDKADVECPEGAGGDTGTEEAASDAVARPKDTGSSGGGGGDTSGTTDTSPTDPGTEDQDYLLLLPPGCKIPLTVTFSPANVGTIWGSLVVESIQADRTKEQEDSNELPDYLRDPTRFRQITYLTAEAERGAGTIVVTPRSFDFGYVYPEETDDEVARIALSNVGTGDLTLGSVALDSSCGTEFSLLSAPATNATLAAGESTLVEVGFDPASSTPAYCSLDIPNNDAASSLVSVTLKGNTGSNPNNEPPTVAVRWPEPGYEYNSPSPLEIEVNVFDRNQPATSLTCKVKSSLQAANIADCTPVEESGHVYISVPRENFETGIDTLSIIVTDESGIQSAASVSVLINTSYPDSDDDGDGYGVETTPPDCDDHNRDTYPDAAEVFDGEDNDCDGVTDEATDGYDDDGDAVSEADGDCNDYNATAYPGAPERPDSVDNDCDGVVDETTSLYDDDGDGFAEVNNDCDDGEATVSPAAPELCLDGLDNNCNGLKDAADQCIATNSEPMVIGFPRPGQMACLENEKIALTVKVFDADGQLPSYAWNSDDAKGQALYDNPVAQTVNFTCPDLADGSGGELVTVYVLATDPDGQQAWGHEDIAVYPDDYELYEDYTRVIVDPNASSTCSTSPLAISGLLAAVGSLAAIRRRRS